MNDLRSLEGVGRLLNQKLHQNNRHKLRSRDRTNSNPTIISTPTPTSNSTPITEYFPPSIATMLSTKIQNGYFSPLPSRIPALRKSHSDFARDDVLSHLDFDNETETDIDMDTEDDEDYIEYLNYNQPECVIMDLPDMVDVTDNINNNHHLEIPPFHSPPNPMSMSLAAPPSLAPLIIEKSMSTEIVSKREGLCITLDDIEDDEEDDIDFVNMKQDYMEYQEGKQKHVFGNIGNGASGIVKKAFHYKSCKLVAIKKCRSKQKQELDAFIKESKLYQEFRDNENIINMLQFGQDIEGDLMMALEYMDLGSTDSLKIHEIVDMKQRELIVGHIIMNVLHALNDLHDNHYVHNDIKPANILSNRYGEIKLSDFGTVSKLHDSDGTHSYLTKNCGTQRYQSPEKMIKCPTYNTKSDIWSVGITCFELLFGANDDKFNHELSYINHFKSGSNLLTPQQHKLSANCCDFINQCLSFDDKQRPSVQQLLNHKWITNDIQSVPFNDMHDRWPWYKSIMDVNNDNLLFMISSLIIHYTKQSLDLSPESKAKALHRRISDDQKEDEHEHDKFGHDGYSDEQRIANIAHYAYCTKEHVIQKIQVTVAYIKSQLNKAEVSRIES